MPRPRSAGDYQDKTTAASRAGLAEVMITLGAYRDALVLIGGWAPHFILEQFGAPEREFVHVGSIDIDLVVDPALVDAQRYATIVELLLDRGYEPGADPLFQFQRTIRSPRDGQDYLVRVDILTPKPLPGEGRTHRHRQVQQDLRPRTLEGAEVALVHWSWYDLQADLPAGGEARVRLRVADLVASLALKGIAIGERYAEKDAFMSVHEACRLLGVVAS